ncbi:hypothetical protein EHO98_16490 [Leptospira stimsonii]|uniref:Glycosidase n=1 Tax=Leptospira stimsonii TaxID=2202203 RepID=A0ABY2MYD3_9LEPT|nr:hypothetical protein EHO98_16490 [Leptospira stimsonii]TGM11824.1 hypothetical protein EHQ90_16665 [Leptospira stimsonii]
MRLLYGRILRKLIGDVDNVVFPFGTTLLPDGDTIHLYCGAADTSIALATGSVSELLERLRKQ